jgi:hypothetical protein
MVGGKVNTGIVHGPQHTRLTRWRALAHSEEGGRPRCKAHWHGRQRRNSMTRMVLLQRLEEDPWGKVVLCDLQHGKQAW